MRKTSLILTLLVVGICSYGQVPITNDVEEFKKQQREKVENFKRQSALEVQAYKDSMNTVYAYFLAQAWEKVQLFKDEIKFKPMPKRPVADPDDPTPLPVIPTPVPKDTIYTPKPEPKDTVVAPKPQPRDTLPKQKIIPPQEATPLPIAGTDPVMPQNPIVPKNIATLSFFGNNYSIPKKTVTLPKLSGKNEKAVSNYWKALSSNRLTDVISTYEDVCQQLEPDEWGKVLLLQSVLQQYLPNSTQNERVITLTFLLNQFGLKAKMARDGNWDLYLLVSPKGRIPNTSFFKYGSDNYYIINPSHKEIEGLWTCQADYSDRCANLDLEIKQLPKLKGDLYDWADYFAAFPTQEFQVIGNTPLSPAFYEYAETEVYPNLLGKSVKEGVNYLLHMIQGHPYKTDKDNYGYEKWNFAEESLVAKYTDCDDNAILFSQLVRFFYDLDVVLIYYPNVHLAAAVHFNDSSLTGDKVNHNGKDYLICDPTYVKAKIGEEMTLKIVKESTKQIIPLNSIK